MKHAGVHVMVHTKWIFFKVVMSVSSEAMFSVNTEYL